MTQILPILFIFVSGYIFKRFHKDSSKELIDLVLYFIFPAFIIYKVHFLEFNSAVYNIMILAFVAFIISMVLTYFVSKIFKLSKNQTAMVAASIAFGNTSFMGFAFVQAYYGEYALSLAIFYDQINMLLLSIFMPIIISYGVSEDKFSLRKVIKSIITFPPLIAFVFAIITKELIFHAVVVNFLEQISILLVPLVIFAVGMKFVLGSVANRKREITVVLALKMLIVPFIIFLVASLFLQHDIAFKVAMVESAMPPMILAIVIAIKGGLDEELGMGALGVGMLISFLTIPLLVNFLA